MTTAASKKVEERRKEGNPSNSGEGRSYGMYIDWIGRHEDEEGCSIV
jgi:hypothetical protein